MKIAMLTSSYPKWAGEGTAPFIEEIAAGLAARGHAVHMVLPFRHDLRRDAEERGVWLHPFRYAPTRRWEMWGYAAGLRGDVELKAATLAVTPLALGQSVRTLARLVRGGGFDVIHAHWLVPNGPVGAAVARACGVPLVVSMHGSDVFFAERNLVAAHAARWTSRHAAMLTACSGDLAARAVALGAPPERTVTVPYGVDDRQFAPVDGTALRQQLGVRPDQPVLLWISRMVYKKGVHVLLDALPQVVQQYPDVLLVLGGDGDLRDEWQQHAERLGLARNVRFIGRVAHGEVNGWWNAGDVVVVPAIHDQSGNVDGLPNMLLEAMSAGRPIVASAIAGIPQVITDGVHGLLVPEHDPAALATALLRLLDDRALAARLGAAARQRVERELRWPYIAARFEAVLEQARANDAALHT